MLDQAWKLSKWSISAPKFHLTDKQSKVWWLMKSDADQAIREKWCTLLNSAGRVSAAVQVFAHQPTVFLAWGKTNWGTFSVSPRHMCPPRVEAPQIWTVHKQMCISTALVSEQHRLRCSSSIQHCLLVSPGLFRYSFWCLPFIRLVSSHPFFSSCTD